MIKRTELKDLPSNWRNALLAAYKEGASDVEVRAVLNGLTSKKFDNLLKNEPEFLGAVELGRLFSQAWWEKEGRRGMWNSRNFNGFIWMANMKNRFAWTDKQNVSIDGEIHSVLDLVKTATAKPKK